MLASWLELDGVSDALAAMSDRAHLDLTRLGTTAGADEIKDTAITQPLVVATALLAAQTFTVPAGAVVAGHSVGEITAATAAGALSAEQAMVFVRERGRAMAAASAVTPTGMSAVMGGDPDELAASLQQHGLTAANNNGGGQVVAAGTLEQLAAFKGQLEAKADRYTAYLSGLRPPSDAGVPG